MDSARAYAALIVSNVLPIGGPDHREIFIRRHGDWTGGFKGGWGVYGWLAARVWRTVTLEHRWDVGERRTRYGTTTETILDVAPSKEAAVQLALAHASSDG